MAPLRPVSAPSSRIANAASRCRRPSQCSANRLLGKSCERAHDARFGSTLALHGSASAPNIAAGVASGTSGAHTGRKTLKQLVAGHGGKVAAAIAKGKSHLLAAEEVLMSCSMANLQCKPQRPASASSLRSAKSTGSRKNSNPRNLLPGAGSRPACVSKIPTPARSRPSLGASLRRPTIDRSGTPLSAPALFDEVIRRDRTYGPILAEIKVAYETFLEDQGASVPQDPIAVVGAAGEGSAASGARPSCLRRPAEHSAATELAVDAARRRWLEPEECELERENAAVRALVERLQVELLNSQQSDSRKQAELSKAQPTESMQHKHAEKWQQLPERASGHHRQQEQLRASDQLQDSRAPTPIRPVLPIPVCRLQAVTGGLHSGRWNSARSSTASTISAHSADDTHLAQLPLGLWAARQTPPGPGIAEASRPQEVPALDLSRISWLLEEASESNEGYETLEDGEGAEQIEITPPPHGAVEYEQYT